MNASEKLCSHVLKYDRMSKQLIWDGHVQRLRRNWRERIDNEIRTRGKSVE